MAILDEITKEKERVGEALARVDAQREKLSSQLSELEATERVLARYSTDRRARKTASAKILSTATTSAAPRSRRRPRSTATRATAGDRAIRSLPWQPARRSRKLLLHARGLA